MRGGDDGGRVDEALQAAAVAAVAARAVLGDRGVAELGGVHRATPVDLMAQDEAAPDARAEVEVGEVGDAAAGAGPAFGDGGGGRVVVEGHVEAGGGGEHLLDGHAAPVGQLRRGDDHADVLVDGAGGGEAEAEDLAALDAGVEQHLVDELGHGRRDERGVGRAGRGAAGDDQRAAQEVDDDGGQLDGVEVQADGAAGVGVEAQDGAWLAAVRRAGAVLAHDALVDQPADDAGDGLRGEPGVLCDLHAADTVGELNLIQHHSTVILSHFREIGPYLSHASPPSFHR
ncbi:hypothetical protein GCM10027610_006460 [Dactylosporangium cerinum]